MREYLFFESNYVMHSFTSRPAFRMAGWPGLAYITDDYMRDSVLGDAIWMLKGWPYSQTPSQMKRGAESESKNGQSKVRARKRQIDMRQDLA